MYKILVTGSRTWIDHQVILDALSAEYTGHADAIMINGDCPNGADVIAKEIWQRQQLPIWLYPAQWNRLGNKRAGFVRNKQMVDLEPDVCLAFIKDNSKGATMTADLAEKAGIRTVRFIA